MKNFAIGLVVKVDPVSLLISLDDGEQIHVAEATFTTEEARNLGLALVKAAARQEATNEQTTSEVAALESLYGKAAEVAPKEQR